MFNKYVWYCMCICVDVYTNTHGHTHYGRVLCTLVHQKEFIHRLERMLAIFWGAEMPKLMSLFLVWLVKFLPATGFFSTLQLTVQYSCQFSIFVIEFQWFKYLLILVKNLVVHIKYNCTHKTINICTFRFSVFIYLLQKEPSFSFLH